MRSNGAVVGYCQTYARWKEVEEFITQHGMIVKTPSGYWHQVPQVSIAQTYLKIMNKLCKQFGLNPSAREVYMMAGKFLFLRKKTSPVDGEV